MSSSSTPIVDAASAGSGFRNASFGQPLSGNVSPGGATALSATFASMSLSPALPASKLDFSDAAFSFGSAPVFSSAASTATASHDSSTTPFTFPSPAQSTSNLPLSPPVFASLKSSRATGDSHSFASFSATSVAAGTPLLAFGISPAVDATNMSSSSSTSALFSFGSTPTATSLFSSSSPSFTSGDSSAKNGVRGKTGKPRNKQGTTSRPTYPLALSGPPFSSALFSSALNASTTADSSGIDDSVCSGSPADTTASPALQSSGPLEVRIGVLPPVTSLPSSSATRSNAAANTKTQQQEQADEQQQQHDHQVARRLQIINSRTFSPLASLTAPHIVLPSESNGAFYDLVQQLELPQLVLSQFTIAAADVDATIPLCRSEAFDSQRALDDELAVLLSAHNALFIRGVAVGFDSRHHMLEEVQISFHIMRSGSVRAGASVVLEDTTSSEGKADRTPLGGAASTAVGLCIPLSPRLRLSVPRSFDVDDGSVQLTSSYRLLPNLTIPLSARLRTISERTKAAVQRMYTDESDAASSMLVFDMVDDAHHLRPGQSGFSLPAALAVHRQRVLDSFNGVYAIPTSVPQVDSHIILVPFASDYLTRCPDNHLTSFMLCYPLSDYLPVSFELEVQSATDVQMCGFHLERPRLRTQLRSRLCGEHSTTLHSDAVATHISTTAAGVSETVECRTEATMWDTGMLHPSVMLFFDGDCRNVLRMADILRHNSGAAGSAAMFSEEMDDQKTAEHSGKRTTRLQRKIVSVRRQPLKTPSPQPPDALTAADTASPAAAHTPTDKFIPATTATVAPHSTAPLTSPRAPRSSSTILSWTLESVLAAHSLVPASAPFVQPSSRPPAVGIAQDARARRLASERPRWNRVECSYNVDECTVNVLKFDNLTLAFSERSAPSSASAIPAPVVLNIQANVQRADLSTFQLSFRHVPSSRAADHSGADTATLMPLRRLQCVINLPADLLPPALLDRVQLSAVTVHLIVDAFTGSVAAVVSTAGCGFSKDKLFFYNRVTPLSTLSSRMRAAVPEVSVLATSSVSRWMRLQCSAVIDPAVFPQLTALTIGRCLEPVYQYLLCETEGGVELSAEQANQFEEGYRGVVNVAQQQLVKSLSIRPTNAVIALQPHLPSGYLELPTSTLSLAPTPADSDFSDAPAMPTPPVSSTQSSEALFGAFMQLAEGSSDLFRHCVDYLDTNSLLFGLLPAVHSLPAITTALVSSACGRRALLSRYGAWSDATLWSAELLSEWRVSAVERGRLTVHRPAAAGAADNPAAQTDRRSHQSHIYWAAIHDLQSRINRYLIRVMRQRKEDILPQLYQRPHGIISTLPHALAARPGTVRPVFLSPPDVMLSLLLCVPPFQPLPALTDRCKVTIHYDRTQTGTVKSTSSRVNFAPFMTEPFLNSGTSTVMLYMGPVYVYADRFTAGRGCAVDMDEVFSRRSIDSKGSASDAARSRQQHRHAARRNKGVRQLYIDDVNQLPVVSRTVDGQLRMLMHSVTAYLQNERVPALVQKTRAMWRDIVIQRNPTHPTAANTTSAHLTPHVERSKRQQKKDRKQAAKRAKASKAAEKKEIAGVEQTAAGETEGSDERTLKHDKHSRKHFTPNCQQPGPRVMVEYVELLMDAQFDALDTNATATEATQK